MSFIPTNSVCVDFGDGVSRRLRYTVAVCKRLVAKYGDAQKMFSLPKYEFLPILFEGILPTDREGITVETLEDNITLPQMDDLMSKFWLAFTGKTLQQLAESGKANSAKNDESQEKTLTVQ